MNKVVNIEQAQGETFATQDHGNAYAALIAARQEFESVLKSSSSHTGKYADMTEVLRATDGPLARHGLLLTHRQVIIDGHLYLSSEVVHASSGQTIGPTLFYINKVGELLGKQPYQAMGSGLTYGRRYNTYSLLNLAAEDNDGAIEQRRLDDQRKAQQQEAERRKAEGQTALDAFADGAGDDMVTLRDGKDASQVKASEVCDALVSTVNSWKNAEHARSVLTENAAVISNSGCVAEIRLAFEEAWGAEVHKGIWD